jgi:hypothetical protein
MTNGRRERRASAAKSSEEVATVTTCPLDIIGV